MQAATDYRIFIAGPTLYLSMILYAWLFFTNKMTGKYTEIKRIYSLNRKFKKMEYKKSV